MTLSELSAGLAERGLISATEPLAVESEPPNVSPWYVQALMGACAWFASLLLFAFVMVELDDAMFRGPDRWRAALTLGLGACIAASVLYAFVKNPFADQFALAVSLAGQLGIATGFAGAWNTRTTLWGVMVLEIVLIVVMRNRLHRILSSLGAIIAYALAMHELIFGSLPDISWTTQVPENPHGLGLLVSVLLWLVVWVPVIGAACWMVLHESQWMAHGRETLFRPVVYGLIAALSIAPLATHPDVFWFALGFGSSTIAGKQVAGVALWPLMAVLLSLVALALAFELRNRPLMGLAIFFGLLEISSFYLVLGTTLLVKALIMASLGAILIGGARWLEMERER